VTQKTPPAERFMIALISLSIFLDALRPWYQITFAPGSTLTEQVASATVVSHDVIARLFLFFATLMLPLIACNVLGCPRRKYTNLGIAALAAIALSWTWMTYMARRALPGVTWIAFEYMQTGLVALAFAFGLAIMLNDELKTRASGATK